MLRQKGFYIFLLLGLMTISIMAPIASDQYLPDANDYVNHLVNILQAHNAILQGSWFYLRIAPLVFHGWFYPEFQFYSPTPYTLAGYIYILFPHNLMDVFKITLGAALVLGGWYSYKLYVFLFRNEIAAVLGAILYLFSPYLLMNIGVRGDLPEIFAQGILPVALYYAFRIFYKEHFDKEKIYFTLVGIFFFYLLVTSHLITFFYTILFASLLFLLFTLQQRNFRNFLYLLMTFMFSILLAIWYLAPVAEYGPTLNMGVQGLSSPWWSNWWTLLPTLLAPKGIAPLPQAITSHYPLYPGLGLPVIISVCFWVYVFGYEGVKNVNKDLDVTLIRTALCVFFVAFFMLWTPCNFWKYLPHQLYVLQFTYRLLIHTAWLGGLLFVPCCILIFKNKLNSAHLVCGGMLLALLGGGWMHTSYYTALAPGLKPVLLTNKVSAWMTSGETFENGGQDYFIANSKIQIPAEYSQSNENLLRIADVQKNCVQERLTAVCSLQIKTRAQYVQLPILYYPGLIKITVNHQQVQYFPTEAKDEYGEYLLAGIHLPPGKYQVQSRFVGISWANFLSTGAWMLYFIMIIVFYMKRKRKV